MNATGTRLEGGCHCGALRYALVWPENAGIIPARRCTCGYCTRFDGTWTSHPEAEISMRHNPGQAPVRYRFGTKTADFLFCSVCGVAVAAFSETGGRLRAVLNINTLDDSDNLEFDHSDSNFDGESVDERLDRRTGRWIGNVNLEPGD